MADYQDNVIDNAATITATATSPVFTRPANANGSHRGVFIARVNADPTGTNPTLDFQVQSSLNGTNWYNVGASQHFTAQGNCRLEFNALEPLFQVVKTIGGTATPTFTLVTSRILFSND